MERDTAGIDALGRQELLGACRRLEATVELLKRNYDAISLRLQTMGDFAARTNQVAALSREINCIDLEEILRLVVTKVPELFGARYASMFLYDYSTNHLVLKRHNHPEPISEMVAMGSGAPTLMSEAIRNGAPLLVRDIDEYEATRKIKLNRLRSDKYLTNSCLILPLVVGGAGTERRIMGVLNLADKLDGGPFAQYDLDVAAQMAELIGTSVSNCQLISEMRSLADTDGLTRLYNHRYFHEQLDREMTRTLRYGRPFCLVLADVDHFKRFNDTHGHLAGDFVLRETSRLLRRSIRANIDVAARYGGEEFAVILPETNLAGGAAAAEKIRREIASQQVRLDEKALRITVSLGVAENAGKFTNSELINRADMALYKAKESGRDRVCLYEDGQIKPAPVRTGAEGGR